MLISGCGRFGIDNIDLYEYETNKRMWDYKKKRVMYQS